MRRDREAWIAEALAALREPDRAFFTGRDRLTRLFFPFAIRYHALHHLAPALPYHNLAAAHAHLLARLPAGSPYRRLEQPSWWAVARTMFRAPAGAAAPSRAQETGAPAES